MGLDGKPFMIHKFRSMHVDAGTSGPVFMSENDPAAPGRPRAAAEPRELPQFWNVLKGEM